MARVYARSGRRRRTGDNHDVGLTRRCTEEDAETIHVVSGSRRVHHLHRASGKAKGHRPHGRLARPIDELAEAGEDVLDALDVGVGGERVHRKGAHL